MTNRERMTRVLDGNLQGLDRLPVIEWASWWDKTVKGWHQENPAMPTERYALYDFFGLDSYRQFWTAVRFPGIPTPAYHGAPLFEGRKEFEEKIRPYLFHEDYFPKLREQLQAVKPLHDRGDIFIWYSLDGFFWFPRTLFGIENHLYAFYDEEELMHEMNEGLVRYHLKTLEVIYDVLTPDFMTIAEDMSYNHGPMVSKGTYDEMMLPYYLRIVPEIKRRGTRVLIDTDGDVEPLIPWFQQAGIDGVLPLERMAGVDVNRVRERYPQWLMIGGYDKTIMHLGEEAMRREFERLMPAMRSGRYIPSVDHQTPPDVSLAQYKVYVRLLHEYAAKAVQ